MIATVPYLYPGAGRQVYPGFLQLAGFMAMNLGNHLASHWEMFKHLVQGDGESADATKEFYEEYRSVCDMTAEFYLQTIDVVFQRHLLPKGEMMHRGRRVDPAAITRHRPARDRGRARRHFGHRPDQGGARHLDRACRRDMKRYHHGQGRRPLRHLQRQQMARPDRAGGRGVDRQARRLTVIPAKAGTPAGKGAATGLHEVPAFAGMSGLGEASGIFRIRNRTAPGPRCGCSDT